MSKLRFQIAGPESYNAVTVDQKASNWNRDPIYQRQAEAWSQEKQALFIDSLLNGFLIPPLYLHEYPTPQKNGTQTYTHALVDGKQRLRAIRDFLANQLPLSDVFVYEADRRIDVRNRTYAEIRRSNPQILDGLTTTPLPVVAIRTSDPEYINQLFSRLNEGVRLNPAEKRNAMPGPFPPATRRLSTHAFFTRHYPRDNHRYRHYDLAAKFLLMQEKGASNLRPSELDGYARQFVNPKQQGDLDARLDGVRAEAQKTLEKLAELVPAQHDALHGAGLTCVLFLLAKDVRDGKWTPKQALGPLLDGFKDVRSKTRQFTPRKGEEWTTAASKVARFNLLNQRNEAQTFTERKEALQWFLDHYKAGADPVKFLGLSQAQLAAFA